jgi:hypothetical protein
MNLNIQRLKAFLFRFYLPCLSSQAAASTSISVVLSKSQTIVHLSLEGGVAHQLSLSHAARQTQGQQSHFFRPLMKVHK